jgi:hypothetical protein
VCVCVRACVRTRACVCMYVHVYVCARCFMSVLYSAMHDPITHSQKHTCVSGTVPDTRRTGGADASAAVLAYEFEALRRLHSSCTKLRVPRPVLSGELADRSTAFIAMEKLVFGARGRGYLDDLGAGLAELHQSVAEDRTYGFPLDGCCGAAAQPNNAEKRQMGWVEFWREFRLEEKLNALKRIYPEDQELQHLGAQVSKSQVYTTSTPIDPTCMPSFSVMAAPAFASILHFTSAQHRACNAHYHFPHPVHHHRARHNQNR